MSSPRRTRHVRLPVETIARVDRTAVALTAKFGRVVTRGEVLVLATGVGLDSLAPETATARVSTP